MRCKHNTGCSVVFSKDEQIGCITVSVLPIRAEIESHNRKYWDALTMSLQTSILRDINELNKYIADATNILNSQPKTISEVGEANMKHAQLMETSAEVSLPLIFILTTLNYRVPRDLNNDN